MKKTVIATLIMGCLMATSVFAGETLSGGWTATTDSAIDVDSQEVFNSAIEGFTGVEYEPVVLLATQVVAGTNYCFLCKSTVAAPDAVSGYSLVYVNEDLLGDAKIIGVKDIDFGEGIPEDTENIPAEHKDEYAIGEPWIVEGQWELTVDAVEETSDRNEYDEREPGAVYIVTFTYKNIDYEDDFMDGLFFSMDDRIVDAEGKMGYSYPGDVTMYPQEAPVGATCTGQACIGVENPGSFKIYVDTYDGNEEEQNAVFYVEVK